MSMNDSNDMLPVTVILRSFSDGTDLTLKTTGFPTVMCLGGRSLDAIRPLSNFASLIGQGNGLPTVIVRFVYHSLDIHR